MDNGEWIMENGEWKMENGKWKMENGEWIMDNGEWRMDYDELFFRFLLASKESLKSFKKLKIISIIITNYDRRRKIILELSLIR